MKTNLRNISAALAVLLIGQMVATQNTASAATTGEPTNAKQAAQQQQANPDITPEMLERVAQRKAAMTPEQLAWEETLEANLGNFYLPHYYKDKDAGKATAWDYVKDDPALPRLLIIGDSISRGYTIPTSRALAGKVNVHRAPANCGPTSMGLNKMDAWLGDGHWDIITWNFGIHDRNTDTETYKKNLETLLKRLQKTGAKILWVRTTPAPPSGKNNENYSQEQCEKLNAVADEFMQYQGVPIVDLNAQLQPQLGELQNADNVHFNEKGYDLMGGLVAAAVLENLKKNQAQP